MTGAELMSVLRAAGVRVSSPEDHVDEALAEAALRQDRHAAPPARPAAPPPGAPPPPPDAPAARPSVVIDWDAPPRRPRRRRLPGGRPSPGSRGRVRAAAGAAAALSVAAVVLVAARYWDGDGAARSAPPAGATAPAVTAPPAAPAAPEAPATPDAPAPVPADAVGTPAPAVTAGAVPVTDVAATRVAGGVRVSYRLGAPALVVAVASDAQGRVARRVIDRRDAGPVAQVFAAPADAPGPTVRISLAPLTGGAATVVTVPPLPAPPPPAPPAPAPAPPAPAPAPDPGAVPTAAFRVVSPAPGAVVPGDPLVLSVERSPGARGLVFLVEVDDRPPQVMTGDRIALAGLPAGPHRIRVTPIGDAGADPAAAQTVEFRTG